MPYKDLERKKEWSGCTDLSGWRAEESCESKPLSKSMARNSKG
jgi:hypothetical protein